MDLAAVFALSLVGGYFFAAGWRLTAYATHRIEGHHLYFRAALCGVIFFGLALLLREQVFARVPLLKSLDAVFTSYVMPVLKEETRPDKAIEVRRAEWVVTALYSLALGPLAAWFLNRVTPKRWAQARTVGALDKLLLRAQAQRVPVAITLNSGKVYIGLVVSITDPDDDPSALVLLPMFSGHRDAEGRMTLTSDYEHLYQSLRDREQRRVLGLPDDWTPQFQMAIRADSVVSANLFSTAVYARFNPDWKQKIARQQDKGPPQEFIVRLRRPP